MRDELRRRIWGAFETERNPAPPMSLRAADAEDSYAEAPKYDSAEDGPTDEYLERYALHGLPYLDSGSWRFYLPLLMDYAVRHIGSTSAGAMAIEGLLWSLRPPDREPPRLSSLTPAQEAVVTDCLRELALADDSRFSEAALQVLEEWWLKPSLYRKPRVPAE